MACSAVGCRNAAAWCEREHNEGETSEEGVCVLTSNIPSHHGQWKCCINPGTPQSLYIRLLLSRTVYVGMYVIRVAK